MATTKGKLRAWLFIGILFIVLGTAGWFLSKPLQRWWDQRHEKKFVVGTPLTEYRVDHVIDGDTISIIPLNYKQSLRIIGIDAPETGSGQTKKECFADESTAHLKELIGDKIVGTNKDGQSREVDRYNRLLRYISVDGKDLGAQMVSDGYAYVYTEFPFDRSEEYKRLEKEARDAQKGLWAPQACNGQR